MIKHSHKIIVIGMVIMLYFLSFPIHSIGCDIEGNDGYSIENDGQTDGRTCDMSVFSDELTTYWAIIVAPPDSNHAPNEEAYYRFATSAESYKEILCNHGWSDDHIKMLTLQNATYANLLDAYEWMANHDKPCDFDVIILIDHGSPTRFYLTGPHDSYSYSEMDGHLELLDSQNIFICISACYSGGAIPFLENEGRIITTASRDNETSTSCFLTSFMNGLDGIGDTVGNNNRVVSVEEAFSITENDSKAGGWEFRPQISDQVPGSFHLIFLQPKDGVIDQASSYPRHGSGGSLIGLNGRKAAQSFIPASEVLTKIQIPVQPMDTYQPLLLSIKQDLTGEDLVSYSLDTSQVNNLWGRFHTIDIPDLQVTPGETYYIVCETPEDGQWTWYNTRNLGKDVYPSGDMYEFTQDHGWTTYDYCDFIFCTFTNVEGNCAPQVPKRPCGPVEGFVETFYNFSFSTTDYENDVISYCVDWGDDSQTWTDPYPPETMVTVAHDWKGNGCYPVRVKAKDSHGQVSDWSSFLYVTIDMNHAPNPSVISGPHAVKRLEENELCFHAVDPEGNNVYYFVYWGDGSTSSWLGPYDSDKDAMISHSWSQCGNNTVWVKVKDDKGRESEWSTCSIYVFPESIIEKPRSGVYFMNTLMRTFTHVDPIIIGNIDVVLDDMYYQSFAYAEFYVDDTKMYTDDSAPFVWNWNKLCFGKCLLKVVLYS